MSAISSEIPNNDTGMLSSEPVKVERDCQWFSSGCVGCCINRRWSEGRLLKYLRDNSNLAVQLWEGGRPRWWQLAVFHAKRGGWNDLLWCLLLVMPTFGLSAWYWRHRWGNCCFAGIIDETDCRVGCLIHPARYGMPDLRRHAFPLVLTVSCDRNLRCSMLDDINCDRSLGWYDVSRRGALSCRKPARSRCSQYADNL